MRDEALKRHGLFVPLCGDPRKLSLKAFLGRGEAFKLLLDIGKLDALVYAGGYWMHDLNPRNLGAITGILRAAKARGRKRGVLAIGAGPIESEKGRAQVRKALGGAEALTVRDDYSKRALETAGVRGVQVTADPALTLRSAPPGQVERILHDAGLDPGMPYMAICPCAWFKMSEFYNRQTEHISLMEQSLARIAERNLGLGLQVVFIASMAPEDLATSERTAASLKNRSKVGIIDAMALLPGQVQAVIGGAVLLVSMRLHPAIFAVNAGTACVAVNYDAKVQELCRRAGLAGWMVSPGRGDFGAEALKQADALLDDPEQQLRVVREARPAMLKALEGNARAIRRLTE